MQRVAALRGTVAIYVVVTASLVVFTSALAALSEQIAALRAERAARDNGDEPNSAASPQN